MITDNIFSAQEIYIYICTRRELHQTMKMSQFYIALSLSNENQESQRKVEMERETEVSLIKRGNFGRAQRHKEQPIRLIHSFIPMKENE